MSDLAKVAELGRLIANDGFAMSFQTLSKYRSALLAKVVELLEDKPSLPPVSVEEGRHE